MPNLRPRTMPPARMLALPLAAVCGLAFGAVSCGDPVTDHAIDALGPEDPRVAPGPSHRPGQPCLLCHHDGGRAPPFSLAGTVYAELTSQTPVGGASVIVIDSSETTFTATTNCAGNFFVPSATFSPHYPIWMTLRAGSVQEEMSSPSYREGSCAGCHTRPLGPASPGPVYLISDPTTQNLPPTTCN